MRHTMTKCVLIFQLEIPQVPHNLFGLCICPNKPVIWDIFEKSSHHMSIVHALIYLLCTNNCCNSCTFFILLLIDSQIVIIFLIIMCVSVLSGMLAYTKSFSHYPYSVMVNEVVHIRSIQQLRFSSYLYIIFYGLYHTQARSF